MPHLDRLNQQATLRRLSEQIQARPGRVADPYQWRMGVVTVATDVRNYGVQLTADGITRTMPSVSEYAPVVGDVVWVAQLGPTYVLVDLVAGPVRQSTRLVSVVFAAVAFVNGVTITYPVPYPVGVVPTVMHSVEIGSGLDILSNLSSPPTNTGATFRLFTRGGGAVSGTAKLSWESIG